jgi:hypothetical protein
MLLAVSQDNSTVWNAYNSLTLNLNRLATTFASALQTSVNSLPSVSEFRLDQVRIDRSIYYPNQT